MRTGGIRVLICLWLSDALRGFAICNAGRLARLADRIDPRLPHQVEPPREWDPRLWARGRDPGNDAEDRPWVCAVAIPS